MRAPSVRFDPKIHLKFGTTFFDDFLARKASNADQGATICLAHWRNFTSRSGRFTCNIQILIRRTRRCGGDVMRFVTHQYSGEPWSNADQFFLSNVLASGMSLAEAAGFLGRTEDEARKHGALMSSAQRRQNRRRGTVKRCSRLAKPIDAVSVPPLNLHKKQQEILPCSEDENQQKIYPRL